MYFLAIGLLLLLMKYMEFGPVAEWPRLCEAWMRQNGWLPPGLK